MNADKELLRKKLREMEAAVRKTERAADIARGKDKQPEPNIVSNANNQTVVKTTQSHHALRDDSKNHQTIVDVKQKKMPKVFGVMAALEKRDKLDAVLGVEVPPEMKRQKQRLREELHILTATRRLKLDEEAEISRVVYEMTQKGNAKINDGLRINSKHHSSVSRRSDKSNDILSSCLFNERVLSTGSPAVTRKSTVDRRRQVAVEELSDVELEFRRRFPAHLFPSYYDCASVAATTANDFLLYHTGQQMSPALSSVNHTDVRAKESRGLSASQSDTDLPIHSPWYVTSATPRMRCYSDDEVSSFPTDHRSYERLADIQRHQKSLDGTTVEISEHFFNDDLRPSVSRDISNDELLSASPSIASTYCSSAFIRPIDYDESRSPRFLTAENLKELAAPILSSSPDVYSSSEYIAHKICYSQHKFTSDVDSMVNRKQNVPSEYPFIYRGPLHSIDVTDFDERVPTTGGRGGDMGDLRSPYDSACFSKSKSCYSSRDSGVYSTKTSSDPYLLLTERESSSSMAMRVDAESGSGRDERQPQLRQVAAGAALSNTQNSAHAVTPAMPILAAVTQRSREFLRSVGSRPLSEDFNNLQITGEANSDGILFTY